MLTPVLPGLSDKLHQSALSVLLRWPAGNLELMDELFLRGGWDYSYLNLALIRHLGKNLY